MGTLQGYYVTRCLIRRRYAFPPPFWLMALRPPPFFCFGEEHLTASLRTQQAHAPVPPLHHLWCLRPARPRACARESNPCEKRRGFLVLPSASCSATPQKSRPKPQQTWPRQLAVHLPASCSAYDSHRFAYSQSMSRYRLSTFFFGASDPPGIRPQARRTGMNTE